MNLSIIAAVGKNNELGKDNDLIWHIKEDMKFFSQTTTGHHLIMGRKTLDSLPGLLKKRKHLVLSRQDLLLPDEVKQYYNVEDFLTDYQDFEDEVFNIGGASIYKELMPYTNKIYLTEIDAESKADVYFPSFDKKLYDHYVLSKHHDEKQDISFQHSLYIRREK